jgi:hypothetical protein
MNNKILVVSTEGKKPIRYKTMAKMGPEISGVKRSQNIPVFSRKDSSEIKAFVKCYEFSNSHS